MSIEVMQRKKGKIYYVRILKDGKRHCRAFNRYHDAQQFEKDVNLNDALLNDKEYTFKQAAEEWIKYATLRKEPGSLLNDRKSLDSNILPRLGHMRIHVIGPQHIENCLFEMKRKGLSNSTLNRNLDIIRAIFNYFLKRGTIYRNPVTAVGRPKIEPRILAFWTNDEIAKFLEHAKQKYENTPLYPVFMFYMIALNTGMRQGEILALRWSDIDFATDVITVARSFSCHTRAIKNSTKSNKIRFIKLNSSLKRLFEEACRWRDGSDLVLSWHGNVLDPHNLRQRHFYRDIKESGVKTIRIHDLRHTFASHFAMNSGDLYALQKILGHSTIRMTERYAHFTRAYLENKAEVVNFSVDGNLIRVNFEKQAQAS